MGWPVIGFIEQNDTVTATQLFQWTIGEPRLWQSLLIQTGNDKRQPAMLLDGLDISTAERDLLCWDFFESKDGKVRFTCPVCTTKPPIWFKIVLSTCRPECQQFLMCMRCAVKGVKVDFRTREREAGRNPDSRRYTNNFCNHYKCTDCLNRGRLLRRDGNHLLHPKGWSRPYIDSILKHPDSQNV